MGNPLYSTPLLQEVPTGANTDRVHPADLGDGSPGAPAARQNHPAAQALSRIPVGGGPEAPPQASLGRSFPVLSGVQAGGHLQSVVGRISWIREAVKGPMLLRRKSRPGHTERAIFTCPGRYRQPRQKPGGPILSKHVLPAPFTPGWSRQGGQLRGRWVPPAARRDGRGLGAAPAPPTKPSPAEGAPNQVKRDGRRRGCLQKASGGGAERARLGPAPQPPAPAELFCLTAKLN